MNSDEYLAMTQLWKKKPDAANYERLFGKQETLVILWVGGRALERFVFWFSPCYDHDYGDDDYYYGYD
jgi:hypothetical protein